MQRIFDGHNDSINHLQRVGDTSGEGFFEGGVLAHLDSPRARKGGFAGGFFALWSPAPNTPMDEFTDGDGTVMNEDRQRHRRRSPRGSDRSPNPLRGRGRDWR